MMRSLMILAALSVAFPALADVNSGGKTIDCFCTDREGARVELGQQICLFVGGRAFMARCEMSLNVPMWRETGVGCISSKLKLPQTLKPAQDTSLIHPKI